MNQKNVNASGFEMVSDKLPKISGYQKAAILLAEIGNPEDDSGYVQYIMRLLKLTPNQVDKLNQAYKSLGSFNPKNEKIVQRENLVMEEAFAYSQKKGFFTPVESPRKKQQNEIKAMVDKNPDAIAQLLGTWLGDEK